MHRWTPGLVHLEETVGIFAEQVVSKLAVAAASAVGQWRDELLREALEEVEQSLLVGLQAGAVLHKLTHNMLQDVYKEGVGGYQYMDCQILLLSEFIGN